MKALSTILKKGLCEMIKANATLAALVMMLVASCTGRSGGPENSSDEQAPSNESVRDADQKITENDLYYKGARGEWVSEWKADPALLQFPELVRLLRKEGVESVQLSSDICMEDRPCSANATEDLQFAGKRLVSVKQTSDAYYGGAHPIGGSSDFLWDRKTRKRVLFGNIFVSWEAVRPILQSQFCRDLRDQYGQDADSDTVQIECPNVENVALTLTGESRADGIMASTSDYQLGGYANGRGDVHMSLTEEIFNSIKAEYRPEFVPPSN